VLSKVVVESAGCEVIKGGWEPGESRSSNAQGSLYDDSVSVLRKGAKCWDALGKQFDWLGSNDLTLPHLRPPTGLDRFECFAAPAWTGLERLSYRIGDQESIRVLPCFGDLVEPDLASVHVMLRPSTAHHVNASVRRVPY
jgi:hypothetical protein